MTKPMVVKAATNSVARRRQLGVAFPLVLVLAGCPEVPRPDTANNPEPTASSPRTPTPSATAEPAPHEVGKRVQIVEKAMGTRITLAAHTTSSHDEAAVRRALMSGLAEIQRIDKLMSTWVPGSEVSRINAAAGASPVKVGHETLDVISKSLWISKLSEGTFDVSFASMGKLWSFDEGVKEVIPAAADVEAARKKIDYRKIKVDAGAQTVMLESADTKINLGGIAKGYAIDRATGAMREAGLTSFFAQAGGDLYIAGRKPDGEMWRVGIRDPRGGEFDYFAMLGVEDHAFSTAGDYERAFVKDGKRYHHIIDPRSGFPATACRSVTIWAKDAFTADAIDNAVFILGPEKGLALVESLEDTGAVIVDKDNKVWISKRLEGLVRVRRQPTPGI